MNFKTFFCGKKDNIYRYVLVSRGSVTSRFDPEPFYFPCKGGEYEAFLNLTESEWESGNCPLPTDWGEPQRTLSDEDIVAILTHAAHEDWSYHDELIWTLDKEPRKCYYMCGDTFAYACADAEEITPEDLPMINQAVKDVRKIDGCSFAGPMLWCSRKRNMRPIREAVKDKIWPLFEEIKNED